MADVFGPWITFLGLVGLTIGVVALFKGELAWAKIHDQKNAASWLQLDLSGWRSDRRLHHFPQVTHPRQRRKQQVLNPHVLQLSRLLAWP